MSKKPAKPISKTTAKGGIAAGGPGKKAPGSLLKAWEKIEGMYSVQELQRKRPETFKGRGEGLILRSLAFKLIAFQKIMRAADSDELLASFADTIGRVANSINASPAGIVERAKIRQIERAGPWPLALSGDPLWSRLWDKEKGQLQKAYFKARGWPSISPWRLPDFSSPIGPVVNKLIKEVVMQHRRGELSIKVLPSFDAQNLSKWQRFVITGLENHPDFPEGRFFDRVKRNPAATTKGKRADEIRKAVRECFRTIKRQLEGEEVLKG
jgi:hypothetical protein